jgi:3-(3-hydroxy-phenyl)propionate hydroxylase
MTQTANVVIAGAGPVGLVCALALAKQGVDVTVLEMEAELIMDQRAGSIQPSTVEMLNTLGLADEFLERGLLAPTYHFRDRITGKVVAEFDYSILNDETAYPFVLQYEQYKVTRDIFAKHGDRDFRVLFSRRVTDVEQSGDTVTVTTNGPHGVETFSGAYLIGADGSHSVVRKSQGIAFEGFTYPERFVKVATFYDFEKAFPDLCPRTYFSDPQEWCNLFKVKAERPEGIWRTVFPSRAGETDEEALSPAGLEARMQRFFPKAGKYEIDNCAIYAVSQRVASTFVKGRVVLAGDAAHVNNPIGGLGLNSGIHDAMNLSEKLVRVLRGEASDSLLSLYDRQRRKAALDFVQEQTIRNKKLLEERDPDVRQKNFENLRRTSEEPDLARAFLRRSALFESLKATALVE